VLYLKINANICLSALYKDMNLLNFIEQFPDEESCRLTYKEVRDRVGVICSELMI